jgi:uncharacterized protein YbjT (DUF2867 family)
LERVGRGIEVKIGVAGATGFVGRALVAALAAEHDCLAFARKAPALAGSTGVALDVGDEEAATDALEGCAAAYYLVHSLESGDFRRRDLRLAESFGRAAARAGLERIVYVGGLGHDPSSDHLASRQEVGVALGAAGVPVVELRAAVVLGSGSISFEMLRYLTERLPFMVCPRWVRTAIQPVALCNMIEYLVASLTVTPDVYEIGGAETTTYRDMIDAYADARGLRRRLIIDIPYLTPRLSSYWVDFVTPVDQRVSHALIESLVTEVVVTDPGRTAAAFKVQPLGLETSIRRALDDQAVALEADLLDRPRGLDEGVYTERMSVDVEETDRAALDADFDRVGGDLNWYGLPWGWRVRIWAGRLMGERWRQHRPRAVVAGERVDWWVIACRAPGELVLRGDEWFPGDGWLGWRVAEGRLVQVGALRPKGVPGFLYWKLLQPIHRKAFEAKTRHRVVRARRGER